MTEIEIIKEELKRRIEKYKDNIYHADWSGDRDSAIRKEECEKILSIFDLIKTEEYGVKKAKVIDSSSEFYGKIVEVRKDKYFYDFYIDMTDGEHFEEKDLEFLKDEKSE